jgi:hypothetical protein
MHLPATCLPLHTASPHSLARRPHRTPTPHPATPVPRTPHAPRPSHHGNEEHHLVRVFEASDEFISNHLRSCEMRHAVPSHYPRTTQPAIHQARHHRLAPSSPCTEDDPKKWHRARMPILDDDVTKSPRSRHTPSALARTTHAQRTHNAMHARTHTQSRDVDVRTRLPPGPCAHCIADDDYPKATKLRPCRNKSYSLRISEACPAPCPALPRPCPAPPLLVLFCP